METSLWAFAHTHSDIFFFLISSCSFPCCKLWASPHLCCAPLRRISLCFHFSEEKAGCVFSLVQNTCWHRDLDKSHEKKNGNNWSTSFSLKLNSGGENGVTVTEPATVLVSDKNLSERRWGENLSSSLALVKLEFHPQKWLPRLSSFRILWKTCEEWFTVPVWWSTSNRSH